MDIEDSCAVMEPPIAAHVMSNNEFCDELIVNELAPFAAVDPPISRAPVVSDENFSTAGMTEISIQTPPSDEVASLEVAPIAAEAEEHSVPIIVNNEPSIQEQAKSPPRRQSERLAARRAAASHLAPSISHSRHTASVPMGRHSQEAPKWQSDRLAAKERLCYKTFL